MAYDWETDDATTGSSARGASGTIRAIASYALFALGIAACWSFFAPFLDAPALAWYAPVLPEILAPTETDVMIDVSPLIAGVLTASVAVWLR